MLFISEGWNTAEGETVTLAGRLRGRPPLYLALMFGSVSDFTFTVSALTAQIQERLESAFDDVAVEGELSNVRQYASGHLYFTLKDADAQLSGVMWRGFTQYLAFEPATGQQVRVSGAISVYAARGIYQIVARSMRPSGEGALLQAFEALKARLAGEGLFDAERKRPLPLLPRTIGIVTSGDGAALRDILSVLSRRFPLVEVLIAPVRVQGAYAVEEIASAVEAFNALDIEGVAAPDLLIVGRGGGSAEDLWAFNEERVVRAVASSAIPVVSAVGHQTDVTLTDFAADVRAATPTEAAELAVPDGAELALRLSGVLAHLTDRMRTRIDERRRRVDLLRHSHALNRPPDRLRALHERAVGLEQRIERVGLRLVEPHRRTVDTLADRLRVLHPELPLRRGYARVTRDGRPVLSARELEPGTDVALRFLDGQRRATIRRDDDRTASDR